MRSIAVVTLILVLSLMAVWAQQWEYAALLVSDASRDETILHVEEIKPLIEGRKILIESREGLVRVEFEAKHVYSGHIVLDRPLERDFLSGARIFQ